MAEYSTDMKGTLGKNKRREKDTHPEYTGKCEIAGVGYWISAWVKENGATGEKFFSLAFKEKDDLDKSGADKLKKQREQTASAQAGFDIDDDQFPF